MEFALKELPDRKGFALCDAKTGEVVPGQVACTVDTSPNLQEVVVSLRFFCLPLFKG
ncbi:MAG TPA: hypothetical protein PKA33_01715 [Amaricoccus sp.]|uniref:hypothetical protein n=1 Tax=Amaricoccus sp. TaxID=1872485 RepID=UPI002C708253|nr:hypothetical protein [Amaricoccus sp.]HMR51188.1 hypothetical protein [Amaricoccus sp.]HMT98064.1 hypothetical protein [Amaricoccus sp.]